MRLVGNFVELSGINECSKVLKQTVFESILYLKEYSKMISKVSTKINKTAICCFNYLYDLAYFIWEMTCLEYVEAEFVTN